MSSQCTDVIKGPAARFEHPRQDVSLGAMRFVFKYLNFGKDVLHQPIRESALVVDQC